jgi:hypothetical protein
MNAGWKDITKTATRVYKIDLNTLPKDVLPEIDPESA